jgi:iron complex outermembrane receptor protein
MKIALALALLFFATPAMAAEAQAQTGSVSGRVFDQTNARLVGVSVELVVPGRTEHLETSTDGTGTYRFENVPAGVVELSFRLINFGTQRRNVTVTADTPLTSRSRGQRPVAPFRAAVPDRRQ